MLNRIRPTARQIKRFIGFRFNSQLQKPTSNKPDDLKKEKVLVFHKVSYEFPRSPKENIPIHVRKKSNDNFIERNKRFIPIVVAVAIGTWGLYTIYYFSNPDAGKSLEGQKLLSPEYFTEFVITNRKDVDEAHFLIELTSKHKDDLKHKYFSKKGFWDGSRLWSVEVKQPQIMVVRNYTPLPLVLENVQGSGVANEPQLRISNDKQDSAKFCLYIKKYDLGEVAKWISRQPIGSILELRGPFIDYQFPPQFVDADSQYLRARMQNVPSKVASDPYPPLHLPNHVPSPDNLVFFAAGTGIAPALQLLLTENPFKGHIWLHYSYRDAQEVPREFKKLFYFLEKLDRITLKTYESSKGEFLSAKDVPAPGPRNETTVVKDKSLELQIQRQKLIEAKLRKLKDGSTKDELISTQQEPVNIVAPVQQSEPKNTNQSETHIYYSNALHQALALKNQPKNNPSLALVCGPDGYISYVAGPKPTELQQGLVAGILGSKGWDETNVYKF